MIRYQNNDIIRIAIPILNVTIRVTGRVRTAAPPFI